VLGATRSGGEVTLQGTDGVALQQGVELGGAEATTMTARMGADMENGRQEVQGRGEDAGQGKCEVGEGDGDGMKEQEECGPQPLLLPCTQSPSRSHALASEQLPEGLRDFWEAQRLIVVDAVRCAQLVMSLVQWAVR
jgi:hypothetical protein